MTGSIAAARLATLAGDFDRSPAYAGLADELRAADRRRPGRRSTSGCPASATSASRSAVSRTTVTRAYAALVESGFAEARQGSGTYTRRARRPAPRPSTGP